MAGALKKRSRGGLPAGGIDPERRALAGQPMSAVEDFVRKKYEQGTYEDKAWGLKAAQTSSNVSNVRARLLKSIANDISPIPEVQNPELKEACRYDLLKFFTTYYPERFYFGWAQFHLDLIKLLQEGILTGSGGKCAYAMPRGSGKTAIAEAAATWALLYGHKRYVLLIMSSSKRAAERLTSIKDSLKFSGRLLADFPEVCYPILQIRNSMSRAKYQHFEGASTNIHWTMDMLALPEIAGSQCSGSVIQCTSITSNFRGINRTMVTGEVLRPELVILDDVQNDRGARSAVTVEAIERAINGAVRGLAGPGVQLSMLFPCTVIRRDDVAERFLDRTKRPEWQGIRHKLIESFPVNLHLWQKFHEIRQTSYREGRKGADATEFYQANRAEMDEGAAVSWAERYDSTCELSALEHAMILYFEDTSTFFSEYQNEPLPDVNAGEKSRLELVSKDLLTRECGLPFGILPRGTVNLTASVDVQGRLLYYLVVAWIEDYGGVIVEAGAYPKQSLDYFRAAEPPNPFTSLVSNKGKLLGPQIFAGLEALRSTVFSRVWKRHDSAGDAADEMVIERVGIDANWNESTEAVYAFCKQYESAGVYHPFHGKGISASNLPMADWPKKLGEKRGRNWVQRTNNISGNRGKHVLFDSNYWKSIVAERLITPKGSEKALLLWGSDTSRMRPQQLQLVCDQLGSEFVVPTMGRGRKVDEWKLRVGAENHYFDCLIMAAVAASFLGLQVHEIVAADTGESGAAPVKARRVAALPPGVKIRAAV